METGTFGNEYAKDISCISRYTNVEPYLSGRGVIIAVIDSGIDYMLPEFLDENGQTRILALWDQSAKPDEAAGKRPPEGYTEGVLYTKEQIDAAIAAGRQGGAEIVPANDSSGHGTGVAAIAAGKTTGVSPDSQLIIIKLGTPPQDSFPRTTQLMRGMDFAVKTAAEMNRPLVINLSFGNTYGDHTGNSILERFIDNISEIGRTNIVVGSGNEGASFGHTSGRVTGRTVVELSVASFETGLNIQIWKNFKDDINMTLVSPNGSRMELGTAFDTPAALSARLQNTTILSYAGKPLPYNMNQEIFIDMIPDSPDAYIDSGIWRIELNPVNVVYGTYNIYLPSYAVRNVGTGFILPTPETTLTIPSTSRRSISVGAYDVYSDSYADFSGRGYVYRYTDSGRLDDVSGITIVKPEIAAPGVDISVPLPGGGYGRVSGTSFAAPFVTGTAALLMEWGIVRGNDRFLYGEKLKAYLIKGARPVRGEDIYPNNKTGWGKLCMWLPD